MLTTIGDSFDSFNQTYQPNQTKLLQPYLRNQAYQIKPTKLNRISQIY